MATVIDELIVTLGLDAKNFDKAQKASVEKLGAFEKQAVKAGKKVKKSNKSLGESFGGVTAGIYKLTGAFLGWNALKSMAEHITTSDNALGRFAANTGNAAQGIKNLQGAAAQFGISQDEITSSLNASAAAVANAQNGIAPSMEMMRSMAQIGVNPSQYFSKTLDDMQRFKLVQEAINKAIDDGRMSQMQAVQYAGNMGYSPNVVAMMVKYKDTLDEIIAAQEKLNTVSDKDIKAAEIRTKWYNNVAQASEDMGRRILTSATAIGDAIIKMDEAMVEKKKKLKAEFTGGDYDFTYDGQVFHEHAPSNVSTGFISRPGLETLTDKIRAIRAEEKAAGLPPNSLVALWGTESSFGTNKKPSKAGALGEFQHMPKFSLAHGEKNPLDFGESLHVTALEMKHLMARFGGDLPKAYAGYNSNQELVNQKFSDGTLPVETRGHIAQSMRYYNELNTQKGGDTKVNINTVNINAGNASGKEVAAGLSNGSTARYAASMNAR